MSDLETSIWKFLNRPKVTSRLKRASDLGRPALDDVDVQSWLLEQFSPEIREDKWKRKTGKIARQVMEAYGYALILKKGRAVRKPLLNKILFQSAAMYTKAVAF